MRNRTRLFGFIISLVVAKAASVEAQTPVHFTFTSPTENNYNIVIDSVVAGCVLAINDEIGVFDGDLCVGASVFLGTFALPLTAWEDDLQTGAVDGYQSGNPMSFRIWRQAQDSEGAMTAMFTVSNGTFGNGIYARAFLSDGQAPEFTCPPDIEIDCAASTDPANTGFATASDPCDDSPTITFLDSQNGDEITRTWTATDAVGNSATCDQLITIDDATPPVITCPPDITVECGDPDDPSATGIATAIDDCDGSPVITHSDVLLGDTITRTWTATDASDNSSSCDQIITIEDTTPPVVNCPAGVVVECGGAIDPTATGAATATDICDASPVVTYADATSGNEITRTWTATDASGNGLSCDQIITIEDTTPPVISCPADVVVECGGSIDPTATDSATATDICDASPVLTYVDATSGDEITRTWTATDASDNSSSCDQIITIEDTTPPVIGCPSDITVECGDSTDPSTTGSASATDNCDADPTMSFADDQADGVITRTWTATDGAGNSASCDQQITLEDTTSPTITCPAAITIECGGSSDPFVTGVATATDICDGSPVLTYVDATSDDEITRTWTATDGAVNSSSCDQIITIEDTTPPVITCPADIVVECGDLTDPSATGTATAIDVCDASPIITFVDVLVDDIITRTWTAVDATENSSSCDQTITIEDTTPPAITCPDGVAVACDESTDPAVTGMATATDVCDGDPTITYSDMQSDDVVTRTWTVTDISGNSVSCEQAITLEDNTAPRIVCPAGSVVECGDPMDPSVTGSATATDNCDGDPVTAFVDSQTGNEITRTWTATDAAGNSVSCDQIITIDDTTPPDVTCPDDVVVECGDPTNPSATGSATAMDICDDSPMVVFTNLQVGNVITRTWIATDVSGNRSSCDQTITIEDNSPPTITCPADIAVDCAGSTDPSATGSAEATDVCSANPVVSFSDDQEGFVITRTWTASDASGNSASCDQLITIEDTTEPAITCPVNVIIPCGSSIDPASIGYATATDDCDADLDLTFVDVWTGGVIDRTWMATDVSGNSAHCNQRITFVGGPLPQEPDTLYSTVDTLVQTEPYTISWDPIPGALEYRLFENGVEIYVGSGLDTTLVKDNVTGLADFLYTLVACNACGCGNASGALTVVVPGQTDVEEGGESGLPTSFNLRQNYPNPFNPITRIDFALSERGLVELVVFNARGQRVAALAYRELAAGSYSFTWDATGYASGVYLYRLTAGDFVATRKMLLLK